MSQGSQSPALQAAEYRRGSSGAPPHKQTPGAARKLSHTLLLIHSVVKPHPELEDEYQEWRRRYPTFHLGVGRLDDLSRRPTIPANGAP
jgi:hypothetical protein